MNAIPLLDDSGFERVLCIAAHPDDLEYGVSAAVARWVDRGAEVAYLLLTAGEAGMQLDPAEVGPLRAIEQRNACAAVGVEQLTILDHPDGLLMEGPDVRRDIARAIRTFKPDVVVVPTWELEAAWGLNHVDHRVTGISVVDALRDADNTWIFPELARDEGLPKWHTSTLLVASHSAPNVAVDVTGEPVQKAIASLNAHEQYLEALPDHPKPEEMIPEFTEGAGMAAGVDNAVLFTRFAM